jgi:hypothetical protein
MKSKQFLHYSRVRAFWAILNLMLFFGMISFAVVNYLSNDLAFIPLGITGLINLAVSCVLARQSLRLYTLSEIWNTNETP